MSANVVDNRAVELQLKNENFEKNAKISLSTLDRLKNALNFKGVNTKVFDGVGKAADLGKAGISNLTGAVHGLSSSLGAIKDVAGFTMIANAATDAYHKVTQLVKSMSTDQIGAGFQKFESITKSMQTIMSATEYAYDSHEEQLADVTRQMEKLNWFADATAFDLNDMTSSIGKFTANKVDLQTATTAIQGIGTWASKSGASVQDASRAMYNLSQAISVGSVKLIDWKSIENANMSTAEFKETAIETAESLGLLTKVEEGLWKTQAGNEVSATNFNEALKDEWFTSEVLLKSLDKYGSFAVKLNDYVSEFADGFSTAKIIELVEQSKDGTIEWEKAAKESGVELSRLKEIIGELGDEQYAFGLKAFKAAMETRTWSDAIDYTKEAVSSGWMNTFQILFGEYEQAKKLWTKVGETMQDVLVTGISKRNALLKEAFGQTDTVTSDQLNGIMNNDLTNGVFANAIRKVAEEAGVQTDSMVSDFEAVRKAVEDGQITVDMLQKARELMMSEPVDSKAGEAVKALAEEDEAVKAFLDTLGNYSEEDLEKITFGDHKYTEGYEELEAGLDNIIKGLGLTQEESEEAINSLKAMGYFGGVAADGLAGYTDEQLKSLGMTEEQIEQFKKARAAGEDFDKILTDMGISTMTAGDHWTQGIYNLLDAVGAFKQVFDQQWESYFPPLEATSISKWLVAFDDGSKKLADWIENSDTLKNVLSGAISVIDLAASNARMFVEALAFKGVAMGFGKLASVVGPLLHLIGAMAKGAAVFNFFKGIIEGLGLDWGKLANQVGVLTQKFVAWFKSMDPINKALTFIQNRGKAIGQSIRKWFDAFLAIPKVSTGIKKLQGGFKIFTEGFSGHMKDGQNRLKAFEEEVEKMGGLKPENFDKIFKMGAEGLLDWIKTFPGVKTMLDALGDIWSGIRQKLIDAGVPIEKIEGAFKKFGSIAMSALRFVFNGFNKVLDAADALWASFLKLPVVNSAITKFGGAFDKVKKTFDPFVKGMPQQWQNFMDRVGKINEGGFKLENVGDIFTAFKEEILAYIANWDGFTAIKDAFKGFFEDIFKEISENETAMTIYHSLKDFFETIEEVVTTVDLPDSFEDIPRFLEDLKKAISGIPDSGEAGGLGGAIFDGAKWLLERIIDLAAFATSHWKLVLGIVLVAFIFKKISGIFGDIREYFRAMTKELKAKAFLETAAGVVLLALAILVIVNAFKDLIELFGKGDFVSNMLHIAPGLIAITVIMLLVTKVFKTVGKMEVKAGTTWGVAASVAAVWVLAKALIDLSNNLGSGMTGIKKVLPAIIAMGVIILAVKSLFKSVSSVDVKPGSIWGIAASLAALWVVAQAFKSLSGLKWSEIGKGIVALGAVILGIIGLMVVASQSRVEPETMYAIAGVIAVMALALAGMAYIAKTDPKALLIAVGSLVAVMASITILAGVVGALKPKITTLAALVVVLGIVVAAIALLNQFVGVEATQSIAESLTKVFVSLAILMAAVAVVGMLPLSGIAKGVLGLVAVLVVLTAVIAAIGYLVNKFDLSDEIATGITTVQSVMDTICMAITGIIQAIGKGLFGDRTPLQMLTDDIAYMTETIASDSFKANIDKIGELNLLSSSGVNLGLVAVLAGIFGAEGAIMSIFNLISEMTTGKTAIESLVDDIKYLAETIGGSAFAAYMSNIGNLNLADATWNLADIGGIAAIFGAEGAIMSIFNLISEMTTDKTAIESIVDDVMYLATSLGSSEFAANMANIGNLNLASATWNLTDIAGITAIFGATGALSTIVDAIIGFATGDKDYSAMDTVLGNVTKLADTIGDPQFLAKMAVINSAEIPTDKINDLAGSVAIFEANGALSTIVDKIIGWAIGEEDFSAMDTTLENIQKLADTLGSDLFTGNMEKFDKVSVPTEKINELAGLIGDLEFDGLVSAIKSKLTSWLTKDEETALENWGDDVEALAGAIGTWNTKMAEAGELVVDSEAIGALTTAVSEITKTGGLAGVIEEFVKGTVNTEEFERRVGSLGSAVGKFNTNMGEVDADRLSSASRVLTSLTTIASKFSDFSLLLDNADNAETAFNHITGSINTMVNNIEDPEEAMQVGQAAAGISTAMSTFSQIKLDGDIVKDDLVSSFKTNVQSVIEAIESTANVDTSGVDKVTSSMDKLNSAKVADDAKNETAALKNAAKSASNSGGDAADSYAKSMASGSGAVADAAGSLVVAASAAIGDVSKFYQAGLNIAGAVAGGIYSAASIVIDAMSSVASQAASAANADTSSAGLNFVTGFANGILLNMYIATAAAARMAQMALDNVKNVINSNSPSKETMKLGGYFGQGFEMGILGSVASVESAASDLGTVAKEGLRDAVGSLSSIITSDIDDDPVIRPVLDLSEIRAGASSINDILKFNEPLSVSANLGAISTTMRNRDTASNSDLLYALGSLQRAVEDNPGNGDTFIVDGVTYDDGSNITDAVRTLVNATVVQRRS